MDSPSKHPLKQPKRSVPDAETKRQHDSWPTQGRLFKFPGKDSNCQEAEYCAYDFGKHMIISPDERPLGVWITIQETAEAPSMIDENTSAMDPMPLR
jgi:hypothetical protein